MSTPEELLAQILKANKKIAFGQTIGTNADGNCTVQTDDGSILARSPDQISAGSAIALKADDGQWYAVSARETGLVQRSVLFSRKNRVEDAVAIYDLIFLFTLANSLYVGGDRDEPELVYDIEDIEDGYSINAVTTINKIDSGYILNFVKRPPFSSTDPWYYCSIVDDELAQVEFTPPSFTYSEQPLRLEVFQHGFYTRLLFDGGLIRPSDILENSITRSNFKNYIQTDILNSASVPFLYYVDQSSIQWVANKLRVIVDGFTIESDAESSDITVLPIISGESLYTPFSIEGKAVSYAINVLNNTVATPVFTDYSYSIPFRSTGFPENQTQQINLNYLPNKTRSVNTAFGLSPAVTTRWFPNPTDTETSTTSRISLEYIGQGNAYDLFVRKDAVVLSGTLPPLDKDFQGNVVVNGTTFRRLRTTRYYYVQEYDTNDIESPFFSQKYLSYDYAGTDPLIFPMDIAGIDYSDLFMTCVRRPIYTYMQVTGDPLFNTDVVIGINRENAAVVDTTPEGVKTITIYNADDSTTIIPSENAYLPVDLFDAFDFTGDAGTNYLTAPNAIYSDGDAIACIGTSLPSGIFPQTNYIVGDMTDAGSSTARFRLYRFGLVVPLVTGGSGRVYKLDFTLPGTLLTLRSPTLTNTVLIRSGSIPRDESFQPISDGEISAVSISLEVEPTITIAAVSYTGVTSTPEPTLTGLGASILI